jgi:hypothetical protein
MIDASIFSRHLDLKHLRGLRGKVRCIFHQERTASLSIDLEAGVFHCFGCGVEGGVKRFAELVGETAPSDVRPAEPETTWQAAMRMVGEQRWSQEAVWRTYELADWVRRTRHAVADVRRLAARDCEACWAVLERAAHLETVANHIEEELDAIASGRP